MTQIKKTIAGLAFAAGGIVLFAGCEREDNVKITVPVRSNRPIGVNVVTSAVTKSVAITTDDLETSEGFVLDAWTNDTWYDLYDDPSIPSTFGLPNESTRTFKGQYIDSGGEVNVKYSSGHLPDATGFGHDAEKTDFWYLVDGSGNVEPYNWITGGDEGGKKFYLSFWARYPKDADVDGIPASEGKRIIIDKPVPGGTTETFTYELPDAYTPLTPPADPLSTPATDATNQKDILFAYNAVHKTHVAPASSAPYYSEFPKALPDDNVDLTFNHPLSMIRFCVSPDDATFDVHLKIRRIQITNMPSSGTCVFNGNGKIKPVSGEDYMFTWSSLGTRKDYYQDYNAMFDVAPAGWTGSSYGSAGKHIYTCNNAFMLIPHQPYYSGTPHDDSNSKIIITFEDTDLGTMTIREIDLNPSSTPDVWKPGYYYTYKIEATKIGRSVTSSVYLLDWEDRDSKELIY